MAEIVSIIGITHNPFMPRCSNKRNNRPALPKCKSVSR